MGRAQEHNREVISQARCRAEEMRIWPSPLEEKMKKYLDINNIRYEDQKIFYITDDDGWIIRYYIADFYIPDLNIVLEVDGKFHNKQKQKDKNRTKRIQENYPGIEVLRFTWKDVCDEGIMGELISKLRNTDMV